MRMMLSSSSSSIFLPNTAAVVTAVLLLVCLTITPTTTTTGVVDGAFITSINLKALRTLVQDVRNTVLPNFIDSINREIGGDNGNSNALSISTQIGACCNRSDTGARASVSIKSIAINNQTLNDPIMTTKQSSSSGNNKKEIATLSFQTRNIDLSTKITSTIAVSLGLGGNGLRCNPALRVSMKLPQVAFDMDLVRGGDNTNTNSFFDVLNGKDTNDENQQVGSPSYQVSMNALQIDPVAFSITVMDDATSVCDELFQPVAGVLNLAASLLSDLATSTFRTTITNYIESIFDTIPVAFDLPIPISIGNFNIQMGLQSLQSTTDGILSVIGTSFSSTIVADLESTSKSTAWRNNYHYNRAIRDTNTIDADVATAISLFQNSNGNNNNLINMRLSYPPVNNFLAAIWYLVWGGLVTDPTVTAHMEDFCDISPTEPPTTDVTDTTDVPIIIDPCPFPPIRSGPFSIFDGMLLRLVFFGNTNFQYQTVIQPPEMDIVRSSSNSSNLLTDIVLQGRVPGKVVLRGTRGFLNTAFSSLFGLDSSTEERTIASLGLDIVMDMTIPSYDSATGIIGWDENGLQLRIENAISETRIQFLGTTFTNLATGFINQFIEERLLGPINGGIQLGLQQLPIRIPSITNVPTQNSNINFQFPNFNMDFIPIAGMTVTSGFQINVTNALSSLSNTNAASSIEEDEAGEQVDTSTIVILAQEIFDASTTTSNKTTIIVFSTVYDSSLDDDSDTGTSLTSRVTNGKNGNLTVEDFVNGNWVTV